WSSHSAIETLNLFCTRALIVRSTLRLPFSEWLSWRSSSRRRTPTTMMVSARASGRAFRGLRALPRGRRETAGHLLDLVRLDDVADLHVLVPFERHAAFVPARDLARVVLEALEGPDATVVHDDVVAQEPRLRAAHDLPVGDEAPGHLTDPGDVERLPHLGTPEHLLLERRLEEAFERVAHVVQRLVDDAVRADVDAFPLRERRRLRLGSDVEAEDDRVRRRGEQHVRLGDAADRAVEDVHPHVVRRE